jgi:hypothetical protein
MDLFLAIVGGLLIAAISFSLGMLRAKNYFLQKEENLACKRSDYIASILQSYYYAMRGKYDVAEELLGQAKEIGEIEGVDPSAFSNQRLTLIKSKINLFKTNEM